MDKNTKTIIDEKGMPKKISNPQGIAQSYLAYLIENMEDKNTGYILTQQVMSLFELVFHIKKGFYCPKCGKEVLYQEILEKTNHYIKEEEIKIREAYSQEFNNDNNDNNDNNQNVQIPEDILEEILYKLKTDYLFSQIKCECGENMEDIFSIKNKGPIKKIVVKGVEINSQEFDELKALIPRQNILDYDGDKYIDPDLKEELEIKAKLQNKDYTAPTLEKQIICVAVGTGYSLEYLQKISMRKLSLLLKTVDAKNMYYAQVQAAMSGMVKFKEDPKHWIFTDSKKNIKDEITSLENFEKKFEHVT